MAGQNPYDGFRFPPRLALKPMSPCRSGASRSRELCGDYARDALDLVRSSSTSERSRWPAHGEQQIERPAGTPEA